MILMISFMEYHLLSSMHDQYIPDDYKSTVAPLNGTAHWRAFQNRLLPGFILENITSKDPYRVFIFMTCLVANLMTFVLYKKYSNRTALINVGLLIFFFILLQYWRWIFGWDLLDIIIFTLFLIGIDRGYGLVYFTILFAGAIFNRETALVIPLWIILNEIRGRKRIWNIIYGGILTAGGIALIQYLRSFFKISCAGYVGADLQHVKFGNHFWLLENLSNPLFSYVGGDDHRFDLIPIFVLVGLFTAWIRIKEIPKEVYKNILIMISLMVLSIFLFTVMHEERQYFVILPFSIYLFSKFNNHYLIVKK